VRLDPIDTGLADYQERYSLTASLVAVILGCVIFVVGVAGGFIVGLVRQAVPLGDLVRSPGFWGFVAIVVPTLAWYVGYGVGWLAAAMTRQVALRVDRQGVLFGRVPFPPRRPVLVPWSSIDEIVAFKRSGTAYSALKPFIGLRLRPGAPRSHRDCQCEKRNARSPDHRISPHQDHAIKRRSAACHRRSSATPWHRGSARAAS